jgi:oligopeptidase A
MAYAENAALREKLYRAQIAVASAGAFDNRPVVARTLALRQELATLLGYKNFADYQAELRMAKSGQRVKEFLGDLEEKTRPFFLAEQAALQAMQPELRAWDVAFLTQKLRQQKFAFNPEELRPYFELDRTLTGMFGLVNKLYGIQVRERKDLPVWHPQVRAFAIQEASGAHLATFYADFFPRESKRSGAWMNQFLVGENGTPHIGVIVSNITPPDAAGKSLLLHREVSTLYHEFGHLLHEIFASVGSRTWPVGRKQRRGSRRKASRSSSCHSFGLDHRNVPRSDGYVSSGGFSKTSAARWSGRSSLSASDARGGGIGVPTGRCPRDRQATPKRAKAGLRGCA